MPAKKRARTSRLWQHFELDAEDGACTCRLCKHPVQRTDGGTSSMWKHLKWNHAVQHAALSHDPKQQKLDVPGPNASASSPSAAWIMRKKDIDHANRLLAEVFVDASLPFLFVEKRSFHKFLTFISHGSYLPPSRTTLTGISSSNYDRMRATLFTEVSQQIVSITTDAAVLTNGHSYVAVTGHYITANWQLRDVVLSVEPADGQHSGEAVRDLLESVQTAWSLSSRTFAAVTDNGANFVKGIRIWARIEERLRCAVHTLQLAIKDALCPKKPDHLPYWAALITKVKKIVFIVKKSSQLSQHLTLMQRQLNAQIANDDANDLADDGDQLPSEEAKVQAVEGIQDSKEEKEEKASRPQRAEEAKDQLNGDGTAAISGGQRERKKGHTYSLVKDVCTRFNSICLVLDRVLLLRRELTVMCAQIDALQPFALSDDEWASIQDGTAVLEKVKELCDILEASTAPTISLMLPLVDSLCAVLDGGHPDMLDVRSLHPCAKDLAERLRTNVNMRTTAIPDFVLASIALDPRMRLSRAVCQPMQTMATSALRRLYSSAELRGFLSSLERGGAQPASSVVQPAGAAVQLVSGQRVSFQQLLSQRTALPAEQDELTRYLNDNRSIDFAHCPMQWWRKHAAEYPTIAQMARVMLCVPASSAPSERVFSYGTITLQSRRHSLKSERVGQLIWMQKNMELYEMLCAV